MEGEALTLPAPRREGGARAERGSRGARAEGEEAEARAAPAAGAWSPPARGRGRAGHVRQPARAGRAVPRRQLPYKLAVTRKSGAGRRRRRTRTPAPRLRGLLSPPRPFARARTPREAGAPARLAPRAPDRRRGARGSRGLLSGAGGRGGEPSPAILPRGTQAARPGARRTRGRAGAATRGRAEAAALGLGFGSYAVEPRRLTWVGPRLGRVRSRCRRLRRPACPRSALGVAAGPPVPLPSHAPPVVPRPSWGRAWSRREGFPFSLAPARATSPDRTRTNLWPRLQGTCVPGTEWGPSRDPGLLTPGGRGTCKRRRTDTQLALCQPA